MSGKYFLYKNVIDRTVIRKIYVNLTSALAEQKKSAVFLMGLS